MEHHRVPDLESLQVSNLPSPTRFRSYNPAQDQNKHTPTSTIKIQSYIFNQEVLRLNPLH